MTPRPMGTLERWAWRGVGVGVAGGLAWRFAGAPVGIWLAVVVSTGAAALLVLLWPRRR
jgi:hypothetical protein